MDEKELLQQWFNKVEAEVEKNIAYLRYSWWTRNELPAVRFDIYISTSCTDKRTHWAWTRKVPTDDIVKALEELNQIINPRYKEGQSWVRCHDCDCLIDYTFCENGPVMLQDRHFCSVTCFMDYEHERNQTD